LGIMGFWGRRDGEPNLTGDAFRRWDETPDEEFYRVPRFVTHIDEGAIRAVTQLYREYFPAGGAVLDLMSSWISHLPPEISYRRVVGLGMNERELARNDRLDAYTLQDLNADPTLPFGDGEFDGVGICVSIDYLTDPVSVLREVGRVSVEGAPTVITFSNRCFPTKAVAVWHELDDAGHVGLVRRYLERSGAFTDIEDHDRSPGGFFGDPLYAVVGRAAGTPDPAS
jgi:SAM-dependent methyltransferase